MWIWMRKRKVTSSRHKREKRLEMLLNLLHTHDPPKRTLPSRKYHRRHSLFLQNFFLSSSFAGSKTHKIISCFSFCSLSVCSSGKMNENFIRRAWMWSMKFQTALKLKYDFLFISSYLERHISIFFQKRHFCVLTIETLRLLKYDWFMRKIARTVSVEVKRSSIFERFKFKYDGNLMKEFMLWRKFKTWEKCFRFDVDPQDSPSRNFLFKWKSYTIFPPFFSELTFVTEVSPSVYLTFLLQHVFVRFVRTDNREIQVASRFWSHKKRAKMSLKARKAHKFPLKFLLSFYAADTDSVVGMEKVDLTIFNFIAAMSHT